MSETMLSQDQLDKYSLYLVFGANSADGNRLVWIALAGPHEALFYRCSVVNNDPEKHILVHIKNVKGMCTHQELKLHRAYRLRKYNRSEASTHRLDFFSMVESMAESVPQERTSYIKWLAALLNHPLITCSRELGQDLKKPRLAEEVATKLFDHGNEPQTEKRVFALSEVVKSKKEWKCIVS
ncbi:hypothetical protein DFH11DRAFT_1795729 [Phellopilus nigrolimitatus]|nr:hypothetical protein DFH11DRAFT_1795729 [Phellopilus nigrolimitatus]